MADATGTYYIDGIDLWTTFGIFVEDGSDGFLRFPPSKEKYTHDWIDQNGIDVDLSRVYTGAKEILLKMAIVVKTEDEFWNNREAFFAMLTQPGPRRISVAEFNRNFFCYYQECTDFKRYTRILNTNLIGCKFTLSMNEFEPENPDSFNRFLITQDGRFIVT
jgi:hypothetical protein